MSTRRVVVSLVLTGLMLVFAPIEVSMAEQSGGYAGWKSCSPCHQTITEAWQKSRHAKAYDSLKKTNQEHLPGCIRCHVTGFEEQGGFIDFELTPELVDVQCESCHGPAALHVSGGGSQGRIRARPQESVCRTCHTPGQDKSFDYTKKIRHVHGG